MACICTQFFFKLIFLRGIGRIFCSHLSEISLQLTIRLHWHWYLACHRTGYKPLIEPITHTRTHARTHTHTHTRIIFKIPWWTEFGGHCTNVSLLLLSSVGTSNVQYVLIIFLQYVGMYVISWSIFLLIIEKIFVLHLIIVVKSVCTLSHSLCRFHETILNMCFITFSYSVKKK